MWPAGLERKDIRTLLVLITFFLFSSMLAGLLSRHSAIAATSVAEEALGFRFYFEPTSAFSLVAALIAAQLLFIFYATRSTAGASMFAAVIFAALTGISALSVGRKILAFYLPDTFPGINFLLAMTVFSAMYVLFLALIGVGSKLVKNLTFFLFAAVSGSLLGVSLGVFLVGLLMPLLAAADTLVSAFRRARMSAEELETLETTAYQSQKWIVGLGDLVSYSLLASLVVLVGGYRLVALALPFFTTGLLTNMTLVAGRQWDYAPGILLPTAVTFIPILYHALLF